MSDARKLYSTLINEMEVKNIQQGLEYFRNLAYKTQFVRQRNRLVDGIDKIIHTLESNA